MSKDTIYRQDAIDALADYIRMVDKVMSMGYLSAEDCKDAAKSVLEGLPSAQPERKKGKWIFLEPNGFKCSECNKYLYIACGDVKMNFCSNCGADMRGDSDEQETTQT